MLYSKMKGLGPNQMILIHGNSQSAESWNPVIEELKGSYKIISFDLPGHGKSFRSSQPEKDYGFPGMSSHLKTFIDQHQQNGYVAIANSAATNLVGEIADTLSNCKGIMLIGASVIGQGISPNEILTSNANLAPFFTPHPAEEAVESMISDGSVDLSESARAQYKDIFQKTDPAFRQHWGTSITNEEWTDEIKKLNSLNIPVAVVYGEQEKFTNVDYLEGSGLKMWRGKILFIAGAGHLIQDEQPGALADLIGEFAEACFRG